MLTVMLPAIAVASPGGLPVTPEGGKGGDGLENLRPVADTAREENAGKVAKMLLEHERISRREVEERLQVSEATANNILRDLVEQGVIARKGSGPSTYYSRPACM